MKGKSCRSGQPNFVSTPFHVVYGIPIHYMHQYIHNQHMETFDHHMETKLALASIQYLGEYVAYCNYTNSFNRDDLFILHI